MSEFKNKEDGAAMPKKGTGLSGKTIIILLAAVLFLWMVWMLLGFMTGGNGTAGTTQKKTAVVPKTVVPPPPVVVTPQKTQAAQPVNTAPVLNTQVNNAPAAVKAKNQVVQPPPTVAATNFVNPKGIAFVEAVIRPMDYELNHRFWGWRPNDIINVTDNVGNFQLGVLEVTRRTAVALAENLSRTASTDSYVPSLENAMNWFMIKPTEYCFPSAESKYQAGLDELRTYLEMLRRGNGKFYARVDNLVPLIKAYESILGSCNENLLRDTGKISSFQADDHFYYAKGAAHAMSIILDAGTKDFYDTIASVQGIDLINNAIESLQQAASIEPILVMEGSPGSIFANHRANIAGPISRARFYLSILVSALTGNV